MPDPSLQELPRPCAEIVDPADLFCYIGDDAFGGVGRGGSPRVRDKIEERRVLFVADRADDGSPARRDGPQQGLVGEGKQILDTPAATGDDDHVHVWITVETAQGIAD